MATKGPKWIGALARRALQLPGDVCEVGVLEGGTLMLMLDTVQKTAVLRSMHVNATPVRVHAVDSWRGMPQPGPKDGDAYPKGFFSQVTFDVFRGKLRELGHPDASYDAWQGWVPEVFQTMPMDLTFSFVHIDLDHYETTLAAADWAWQRLVPGGVVAFHDWRPAQSLLAPAAVTVFLDRVAREGDGLLSVAVEDDEFMVVRPGWRGEKL